MPNRIIKESIRTSDTLASVSAEAERLFWRLIASADDFGRYDARLNTILGQCLTPFIQKFTHAQVQDWLIELQGVDLIRMYEVDGQPYLELTKWDKHQRPRAKASKYPSFEDENAKPLTFDSKCCQAETNDGSNVFGNVFGNGSDNEKDKDQKTGGDAHAREETKTIVRTFEHSFGRLPNSIQLEDLHQFVKDGMEIELVLNAIRTSKGKERSFDYAKGILERQFDRGIRSVEQADAYDREYKSRASPKPSDLADRNKKELDEYLQEWGDSGDDTSGDSQSFRTSVMRISEARNKTWDG